MHLTNLKPYGFGINFLTNIVDKKTSLMTNKVELGFGQIFSYITSLFFSVLTPVSVAQRSDGSEAATVQNKSSKG